MGKRSFFRVSPATLNAVESDAPITGTENSPTNRIAVPVALRVLNMKTAAIGFPPLMTIL